MRAQRWSRGSRCGQAAILGLLVLLAALVLGVLLLRGGTRNDPSLGAAERGGYQDSELDAARLAESEASPLAVPTGVTAGGRNAGLQAGVRLAGDGRLSGFVLERGSGAAVPGVEVCLLGVPPSTAGFLGRLLGMTGMGPGMAQRAEPAATVVSGALGQFEFLGVRAGNWYVDVRGPYHLGEGAAMAAVLASGDGGPLEVWARGGGRVLGQVQGPQGEPLSGVRVLLTQGPEVFVLAAERGELRLFEGVSDADGRFAFPAVPPGVGYEVTAIGSGLTASHSVGHRVVAGQDTEVVVGGLRGARVRGRIMGQDASGELVPIVGAEVGAVPRGLRHMRVAKEILSQSHAVTSADGSYELASVPSGEVDVLARAPGFVPGRGPSVRCVERGVHAAADLVLRAGPSVEGLVINAAGEPIDDAQVRYDLVDVRSMGRALSAAPLLAQAMAEFDYPRSDGLGEFVAGPLAGEPPYRLTISADGFADAQVQVAADALGDRVTVTMQAGGTVSGRVVDRATGEPLTRFTIDTIDRVELESGAPGRLNPFTGGELVQDPDGAFTVFPLKPGEVRLQFRAEGYLLEEPAPLALEAGGAVADLVVSLQRGGEIRGQVVDPDGQPLPGVRITTDRVLERFGKTIEQRRKGARSELGLPMPPRPERPGQGPDAVLVRFAASLGLISEGMVSSGDDGSFAFTGLEPGTHTLLAFHRDWQVGREGPLQVVLGTPLEGVRVQLDTGATLFGQVTDRFDRALDGAMVMALAPSNLTGRGVAGGGVFQGRTDDQGRYEIRRLEPGGYMVITTRGDEAMDPLSLLGSVNLGLVQVPEGQRVRHDIVDTSIGACRVHGSVSEGGELLTRGSVVALAFEAPGLLGVDVKVAGIDQDGSYAFEGLAPGEYRMQIESDGMRTRLIIEVPDAPELALDLAVPLGSVAGRVVDAVTGEGISGAQLLGSWGEDLEPSGAFGSLFSRGGAAVRGRTDGDGRFLLKRLGEGDWELNVQPPRREGASWSPGEPTWVEIGRDEALSDVEIALEPGLEVPGRVIDEQGQGVAEAEVLGIMLDTELGRPARAISDEQGKFLIGGLGPGPVRLSISATGFADSSLDLELSRERQAEAAEVQLQRGSLVEVLVADGAGLPLAGATARLVSEGEAGPLPSLGGGITDLMRGFFAGDIATDDEGRLDLGRYAGGDYVLEVRKGLKSQRKTVRIDGGRAQTQLRASL